MKIDLRKLNHLVAVARVGSLSKAAEQLYISQPALSRSIALVEEQVGGRLFERGASGVSLTGLGKIVVAEAHKLLQQAQIFDHNVELYSRGEFGAVAFGMWPALGSLILPELSTHFMSARPDIKMTAAVKAPSALLQELYDDKLELMFSAKGLFESSPDLTITTIGHLAVSALVRGGHPLAKLERVMLDDMFAYPMLCGVELTQVPEYFRNSGFFFCESFEVLRHTTLNSDGYWIAPRLLAGKELESGLLQAIAVEGRAEIERTEIQMIHLRDYQLSPAARDVASYVQAFFSGLVAQ